MHIRRCRCAPPAVIQMGLLCSPFLCIAVAKQTSCHGCALAGTGRFVTSITYHLGEHSVLCRCQSGARKTMVTTASRQNPLHLEGVLPGLNRLPFNGKRLAFHNTANGQRLACLDCVIEVYLYFAD